MLDPKQTFNFCCGDLLIDLLNKQMILIYNVVGSHDDKQASYYEVILVVAAADKIFLTFISTENLNHNVLTNFSSKNYVVLRYNA